VSPYPCPLCQAPYTFGWTSDRAGAGSVCVACRRRECQAKGWPTDGLRAITAEEMDNAAHANAIDDLKRGAGVPSAELPVLVTLSLAEAEALHVAALLGRADLGPAGIGDAHNALATALAKSAAAIAVRIGHRPPTPTPATTGGA